MLKSVADVTVDDLKRRGRAGLVNTVYVIDLVFPETYLDRKSLGQIGALAINHRAITELMLCSYYSNLNDIKGGYAYVTLEISENYLLIFYRDLLSAADVVKVIVEDDAPTTTTEPQEVKGKSKAKAVDAVVEVSDSSTTDKEEVVVPLASEEAPKQAKTVKKSSPPRRTTRATKK